MTPELKKQIEEKAKALFVKVQGYRRHLHAHPELSYQEHETMAYVAEQLQSIGIPFTKGVGNTGIIAMIRGDHHSETDAAIGLRADLDALPIHEENEVPYKSTKDGLMHACGHDVHTSILLGAAEVLYGLRNELPRPVKLVFQPGEEKNPGGATLMLKDGVLENPKVTEMIALHVFPDMEVGRLGFKEGLYMASCDEIYVTVNGKGGHGATPNRCIDPIVIGANIVTSLQQIVSRRCDPKIPCVLSFGHFEALGATNVIPSSAHLKGTFRTMDEPWRAEALEIIESSIKDIAKAGGGTADVEISKGYPYLENNPEVTQRMRKMAQEMIDADNVDELPIRLTSEDFSYYSQEIPVCFFRLGVRNESKGIVHSVHHPRFDIDEEALTLGVTMMSAAAFI